MSKRTEISSGRQEEDMEGVYTTGIDAIVGGPRRRSGRAPRVSRVTMPPMRVSARGGKSLADINPALAALLNQLDYNTMAARNVRKAGSQESFWAGSYRRRAF
jgi:hypothetical protein